MKGIEDDVSLLDACGAACKRDEGRRGLHHTPGLGVAPRGPPEKRKAGMRDGRFLPLDEVEPSMRRHLPTKSSLLISEVVLRRVADGGRQRDGVPLLLRVKRRGRC